MKKKKTLYLVVATALVLFGIYGAVKLANTPGKYDGFAKCLTGKGVVMFGTDWCPHCKAQKAMFGKSFRHVKYVNCEIEKTKCNSAGVRGYPTWAIRGKNYPGTRQLNNLAVLSGCDLEVK